MSSLIRLWVFLFFVLSSLPVMAQQGDRNAFLDIFPSKTAIERGETIDLAIRQTIRDGWHTYWYNAGDSGEPLAIEWTLPEGVKASNLSFPTPKRIYYDPLVNFGYEGAPIYTQRITIPEGFEDDYLTLDGEATWLVCEEICIPESQSIKIKLPVGDGVPMNEMIFEQAQSAMPSNVDWSASLTQSGTDALLTVAIPYHLRQHFTEVELYPYGWGIIETTSAIISDIGDETVTFSATAGGRDFNDIDDGRFVLKTDHASYEILAETASAVSLPKSSVGSPSLIVMIAFAFIGGVILNLMPCVFPVLSMKAISLVKLSDKERAHVRASGLAYSAGIVLTFLTIAGLLIALKGAGASIGWGFQLQNPFVVTGLATLLFLIGLNLLGVFDIGGRLVGIGSGLAKGNSIRSSFFTGVLATMVATPCTAPFMASAIGYALTQNAVVSLCIFAFLGLGLAFPYLLLCFIPSVQRILPKPGEWMNTFKQALAFPMFASAIWLVWVLEQQSGDLGVLYVLGLFLAIGFMIWLIKVGSSRLWRLVFGGLLTLLFALYAPVLVPNTSTDHVAFDADFLEKTLDQSPDQPVFVNMTAAWCITCLVNERTSLSHDSVQSAFKDQNVLYIKGDWTNRDGHITKYLETYGRNGVPLYVYYGPARNNEGGRPDPVILPQILTPDIVLNTLKGDQE